MCAARGTFGLAIVTNRVLSLPGNDAGPVTARRRARSEALPSDMTSKPQIFALTHTVA